MNKVDGILRLDVKLDVDHDDFYCDFIKPDPIKSEDRTWLKIAYDLLRPSDANKRWKRYDRCNLETVSRKNAANSLQ